MTEHWLQKNWKQSLKVLVFALSMLLLLINSLEQKSSFRASSCSAGGKNSVSTSFRHWLLPILSQFSQSALFFLGFRGSSFSLNKETKIHAEMLENIQHLTMLIHERRNHTKNIFCSCSQLISFLHVSRPKLCVHLSCFSWTPRALPIFIRWFCHPNNVFWQVKIMKLLIMQFSLSCFLSRVLFSTFFSDNLNLYSSLRVKDQLSHPYKVTQNSSFIYFTVATVGCVYTRDIMYSIIFCGY